MPRVKRRAKTRRERYTERFVRYLIDGHDWDFLGQAEAPATDEELAQAWEEIGDELMAACAPEVPTYHFIARGMGLVDALDAHRKTRPQTTNPGNVAGMKGI